MRNSCLPALLILLFLRADAQQLYFNHLSVNNGLSQGVNNCIFKDSKGFVWISSFDGLNRFDGLDCRRYYASTANQAGIRGTLFLNMLEDRSANLWIGSNEGLNYYNRQTDNFYCYQIQQAPGNDRFCSPFYIDNRNRVWVQSGTDIYTFDPSTKRFSLISSSLSNGNFIIKTLPVQLYQPVQKILTVSSNNTVLWSGTLLADTIGWRRFQLPLKDISINTMQVAGNGDCWLGTSNGLYRLDAANPGASCSKMQAAAGTSVSAVHIDNTGAVWIGTLADGLFKADVNGNVLAQYKSSADNSYAISANQVLYVYTDDDRNLWVAVWGKGIDYTSLGKFHFNQYITKSQALKFKTDNFIRSIVGTNDEIWCALQAGGIMILDTAKNIRQVIQSEFPAAVESLLADGNQVWAATFKGLCRVNAKTKAVYKTEFANIPASKASSSYNYISKLPGGNLLLSSNAGLYQVKNKDGKPMLEQVKGTSNEDVYLTTYSDAAGRLYVSKAFKGFGVYWLQNDSLVLIKEFPLHASIKCFSDTPDSLLWIGSTIGLIKFNKTTSRVSRVYTTADGLSNQYVYGIVPDGKFLWLSTNAGISRFDPATAAVKSFSVADGLQSNEYNTYSFYKTFKGELLFGGVNGLNGFYPATFNAFSAPPALVLSSVQLNDTLFNAPHGYAALNALNVDYKQNTIGFQFAVIDYVNAAAATISYMLEGYDKGWVTTANKSFIRYANLPAGSYTLKVKAFNADGVMAKNIYTLPVTVNAPWWKSWLFRLLLATGMIVLVAIFINAYLRKKLQRQRVALEKELAVEQERIRMARELHDGLGSMLSGIKHSFSAIKNEAALNEEQRQRFDYTIEKLDDSIKDLRAVSHSMFSAELLEDGLEAAVRNYCNALSATSGIDIAFENIMQQPGSLKGDQAFHIFRVVQELVQNVIKHSKATEAIVQLSYDNKIMALTVEDDGVGFNTSMQHGKNGIGLKNVESRVKMLHGKIDIQSQPGKGTSVFIEMPVH